MASAAQIAANQANAQHSTGPRTEAGKAAVAHNRLTHGLSSPGFFILPGEDAAEFLLLRGAFQDEYRPVTATELFLVDEMSHARWKLLRLARMEAALLTATEDPLLESFRDVSTADALLRLSRYENAIRRNWFRAYAELRALRRDAARGHAADTKRRQAEAAERFNRMLEEATAPPTPAAPPPDDAKPTCESKPMPAHLERELAAHKRRDPLFDPKMDASQMSKELRRWFEKSAIA
jgi:hypothetical protein